MTDRELIKACHTLIARYGTLRFCGGGICACMGCVNRTLSKEQYEYALTLPQVQEMLENPPHLWRERPDGTLAQRLEAYKRSKLPPESAFDEGVRLAKEGVLLSDTWAKTSHENFDKLDDVLEGWMSINGGDDGKKDQTYPITLE